MLLYADSKLEQLQSLANTLNENVKTAQEMLQPAQIQSALQTQFNTLHTQNNTQLETLKQTLQTHITESLTQALTQLNNDNTTQLNQTINDILTNEKIQNLITFDIEAIIEKISADFILTQSKNINADISQSMQAHLHTQLQEAITEQIDNNFMQVLETKITEAITQNLEKEANIALSQEQINTLALHIYNNADNRAHFYTTFSKIFNEKVQTNTDIITLIGDIFSNKIDIFFNTQQLDFKTFLLKHYDMWIMQLDSIALTNHIILKDELENLALKHQKILENERLKYEQELAQKRKEWQESLDNPNAIKHNIYQAI